MALERVAVERQQVLDRCKIKFVSWNFKNRKIFREESSLKLKRYDKNYVFRFDWGNF